MKRWAIALAFLAIPFVVQAAGARITGAVIRGHTLALEVVSTPDSMRTGLMFRDRLDPDTGMLFVYPQPQPLSFWMRNTRLPLSIAFFGTDGIIRNIEDMAPFDEKTMHRSKGPARYAIEVNRGWFREKGIQAGDRVRLIKTVDADGPER